MDDTTWESEIMTHYVRRWGGHGRPSAFPAGKALDLPAMFRVIAFPPSNVWPLWTYATCGMSQPHDARPVELFMMAPYSAPSLVELLYATAHFHRAGDGLVLDDTVNFGRSWVGSSACTHGLVSLPVLDGPALETATIQGRELKVYWLLPVTESEVAYKKAHGIRALEAAFDRVSLEFAVPGRASAVDHISAS